MHRKAIGLSFGLALVFAALPAVAAFSFGGASVPGDAATKAPITIEYRAMEKDPLTMGVEGKGSGCDLDDAGVDSARF